MLHPRKPRRALATLTLILAATFAAVPDAGAAAHRPGARAAQTRAAHSVRGFRLLETVAGLLRKAGIEIDPNGLADGVVTILTDGW